MAINRDKVEAQAIKLLQQGKLDKAILELKKIVEHDPTDVRTLLKMGDTYVKLGAKKESIDAYEKAAGIYTEQGFFLKAVAVYKQILRVDASPPGLHLKLAELYQQLGLVNDALQHYQNVALHHEQNGRPKESLEILKRMVDLDPDNLASRIKLAELFAQQGHGSDAVSELRSALSFLKTQQRFDDYLRVGEKLVAYDASALDVARELAQIYMQRGQASVALSKLQMCFKADPRNIDILSMIAQAFLDMQQIPKTVSVYKEMAKIYSADEREDLAQQTWERVLELQPGDPDAEAALGHSPTTLRAPAVPTMVAPAMANAPMMSAPSRPSVEDEQLARLLTETDVYVKYGLKEKAIEHLQKVFAIRDDYVPALEKLVRLLQGTGGPGYVDALRNLVAAAETSEHPSLTQWRTELVTAAAASSRAPAPTRAAPVPARSSISDEGDVILVDDPSQSNLVLDEVMIDDPSGALLIDDSSGLLAAQASDEPLPGDSATLDVLPPDEAYGDGPREIPRMPTGVLPSLNAGGAARPPPPPLTDEISGADADALVRQALQDVSEADVEAAAELVLSDEQDAIEDGADFSSADELDITARAGTLPVDDELDRIARQAVADAHAGVAAGARPADVASTAMTELTSAELQEIREFDDLSGVTAPVEPTPLAPPAPPTWARVPDEFGERTLALLPGQSSDVPTDERPKRTQPGIVLAPPAAPALVDASDDDDVKTLALDGVAGLRTAPDRSIASSPAAAPAAPAGVRAPTAAAGAFEAEVSEEFDPSSFDLPAEVKEMLRRQGPSQVGAPTPGPSPSPAPLSPAPLSQAPPSLALQPPAPVAAVATAPAVALLDEPSVDVSTTRDKLGLKAKAQGFENDPANQFFHDELEEAEFFIQQELLDEAREILTAILDDVPDSARVQWMLARVEARENGQPEPSAPWEQRILEEVQAQLENLGLDEARAEPEPETQQISVDQVLSQFKQKIAEVIPAEDAATHYELGNAYRDMGLLDDACAEFLVAARNPGKAADARYLIGLTRLDQGRVDDAIEALEAAVGTPNASRTQRGASNYQLGICLEQAGRGAMALGAFKAAKADGHAAADLDRRIKALLDKHGDDDGSNGHGKAGVAVASTRAKNIDYV